MKPKISHGGSAITLREYELRDLDENGDVIDVCGFGNKREAIDYANRILPSSRAVVIELHTSRRPAHLFAEPDKYETVATFGDEAALREGGWID